MAVRVARHGIVASARRVIIVYVQFLPLVPLIDTSLHLAP